MKKRIPFNVKYRPQIESGKYKVETERGVPVRIICWDRKDDTYPIIACREVDGKECPPQTFTKEGHFTVCENTFGCDLWCVFDSVEITEDYVPFYIAILLKKGGFDVPVDTYYLCEGAAVGSPVDNHNAKEGRNSRPTLQMALKWLREVHGLYISVLLSSPGKYIFSVRSVETSLVLNTVLPIYPNNTYEEAAIAAIEYCLENLENET